MENHGKTFGKKRNDKEQQLKQLERRARSFSLFLIMRRMEMVRVADFTKTVWWGMFGFFLLLPLFYRLFYLMFNLDKVKSLSCIIDAQSLKMLMIRASMLTIFYLFLNTKVKDITGLSIDLKNGIENSSQLQRVTIFNFEILIISYFLMTFLIIYNVYLFNRKSKSFFINDISKLSEISIFGKSLAIIFFLLILIKKNEISKFIYKMYLEDDFILSFFSPITIAILFVIAIFSSFLSFQYRNSVFINITILISILIYILFRNIDISKSRWENEFFIFADSNILILVIFVTLLFNSLFLIVGEIEKRFLDDSNINNLIAILALIISTLAIVFN